MFSHNGKWVATGESGNVSLWETDNYERLHSIPLGNSSANRLSFSPDDTRLAAGAEDVYILDPAAGVPLLRFQPNDDTIYYLSFSPGGSRLASCTTGGMISISGPRSGSNSADSKNSVAR